MASNKLEDFSEATVQGQGSVMRRPEGAGGLCNPMELCDRYDTIQLGTQPLCSRCGIITLGPTTRLL